MPLYIGDYIADTSRLSTLEHGAYMLLIMDYWRNGSLPNDDKKLARIVRLSDQDWAAIKENIAELFLPDWKHKRIERELARSLKKSEEAKAAAEKRWQSKGNAVEHANAMPTHSECNADAYADAILPQPQSSNEDSSSFHSDDSVATAPPTVRKRKASTAISQELPINWQPDDSDRDYARVNNFPASIFEKSLEDMRLWAKANRIRKHDWHATLKGFMRRDAEKLANGISNARAGPQTAPKENFFYKRAREKLAENQSHEPSRNQAIDDPGSDEPSAFSRSFDLSADATS
jgi:uncharacterized protein YdaU (DUF1376 family)